MGAPKFKVGDKVRLNRKLIPNKVLKWLRWNRTRTVVSVCWVNTRQHCFYELGERGKARIPYYFRGDMLIPVTDEQLHTLGRPKTKRKYTRRQTMSKSFKKWLELTETQRTAAEKRALFVGYKTTDLPYLLFEFDGDKLQTIRDNYLLGGVFPAKVPK